MNIYHLHSPEMKSKNVFFLLPHNFLIHFVAETKVVKPILRDFDELYYLFAFLVVDTTSPMLVFK